MKYGEFIRFSSYLDGGDDYPKGFKDTERTRLYKELGFVHPCEIPLYKSFPCKLFSYEAEVCGEYANEYTTAVRKYMLLYFKAAGNYELILESLKTISTDKQLRDNFPELLIFYTIPEDKGRELVPIETLNRCKALLRESRQLILENL
jgi:hypothetical protein